MRKITGAVLVALAMTMLVTAVAQGDHRDPQISIAPATTVNVDTEVTVSAWDTTTNGDVHIDECLLNGLPTSHQACLEGATGSEWVNRATKNNTQAGGNAAAMYVFTPDTAGVYGFRARSAHNESYQDLTVSPLTSGDRHQGCNGIENAITKVKEGGNAKLKLDAIAAKFHCDV